MRRQKTRSIDIVLLSAAALLVLAAGGMALPAQTSASLFARFFTFFQEWVRTGHQPGPLPTDSGSRNDPGTAENPAPFDPPYLDAVHPRGDEQSAAYVPIPLPVDPDPPTIPEGILELGPFHGSPDLGDTIPDTPFASPWSMRGEGDIAAFDTGAQVPVEEPAIPEDFSVVQENSNGVGTGEQGNTFVPKDRPLPHTKTDSTCGRKTESYDKYQWRRVGCNDDFSNSTSMTITEDGSTVAFVSEDRKLVVFEDQTTLAVSRVAAPLGILLDQVSVTTAENETFIALGVETVGKRSMDTLLSYQRGTGVWTVLRTGLFSTADGRYIAYYGGKGTWNEPKGYRILDRTTLSDELIPILSKGNASIVGVPAVSANGRFVGYLSSREPHHVGPRFYPDQIIVHDRLTKQNAIRDYAPPAGAVMGIIDVSNDGAIIDLHPGVGAGISPNGRYIAYFAPKENTYAMDGVRMYDRQTQKYTFPQYERAPLAARVGTVDVSDDGKNVALVYDRHPEVFHRFSVATGDLSTLPLTALSIPRNRFVFPLVDAKGKQYSLQTIKSGYMEILMDYAKHDVYLVGKGHLVNMTESFPNMLTVFVNGNDAVMGGAWVLSSRYLRDEQRWVSTTEIFVRGICQSSPAADEEQKCPDEPKHCGNRLCEIEKNENWFTCKADCEGHGWGPDYTPRLLDDVHPGCWGVRDASLSANGLVVYTSDFDNLSPVSSVYELENSFPGDPATEMRRYPYGVFLHDPRSRTTTHLGHGINASISKDGSIVVYVVAEREIGVWRSYAIYDVSRRTTVTIPMEAPFKKSELRDASCQGIEGQGGISVSEDGTYIAFVPTNWPRTSVIYNRKTGKYQLQRCSIGLRNPEDVHRYRLIEFSLTNPYIGLRFMRLDPDTGDLYPGIKVGEDSDQSPMDLSKQNAIAGWRDNSQEGYSTFVNMETGRRRTVPCVLGRTANDLSMCLTHLPLTNADTNNRTDVYLFHAQDGSFTRATVNSEGVQGSCSWDNGTPTWMNVVTGDGDGAIEFNARCGDGVRVKKKEWCDWGGFNSNSKPDFCRTNCTLPRCGDDVVDGDESCDDGNAEGGDACPADCGRSQKTPRYCKSAYDAYVSAADTRCSTDADCTKFQYKKGGVSCGISLNKQSLPAVQSTADDLFLCKRAWPPIPGGDAPLPPSSQTVKECEEDRWVAVCGKASYNMNTCTWAPDATPRCGNSVVDPGEQCDDGNFNGKQEATCSKDCKILSLADQCNRCGSTENFYCKEPCAVKLDFCMPGPQCPTIERPSPVPGVWQIHYKGDESRGWLSDQDCSAPTKTIDDCTGIKYEEGFCDYKCNDVTSDLAKCAEWQRTADAAACGDPTYPGCSFAVDRSDADGDTCPDQPCRLQCKEYFTYQSPPAAAPPTFTTVTPINAQALHVSADGNKFFVLTTTKSNPTIEDFVMIDRATGQADLLPPIPDEIIFPKIPLYPGQTLEKKSYTVRQDVAGVAQDGSVAFAVTWSVLVRSGPQAWNMLPRSESVTLFYDARTKMYTNLRGRGRLYTSDAQGQISVLEDPRYVMWQSAGRLHAIDQTLRYILLDVPDVGGRTTGIPILLDRVSGTETILKNLKANEIVHAVLKDDGQEVLLITDIAKSRSSLFLYDVETGLKQGIAVPVGKEDMVGITQVFASKDLGMIGMNVGVRQHGGKSMEQFRTPRNIPSLFLRSGGAWEALFKGTPYEGQGSVSIVAMSSDGTRFLLTSKILHLDYTPASTLVKMDYAKSGRSLLWLYDRTKQSFMLIDTNVDWARPPGLSLDGTVLFRRDGTSLRVSVVP